MKDCKNAQFHCPSLQPFTAFFRRTLVHCTNDRASEGVRSLKLYKTLRSRQFPHMHNAVSSLIACEDTIMCKGGNGQAQSVLHGSHYEGGHRLWGKTRQDKTKVLYAVEQPRRKINVLVFHNYVSSQDELAKRHNC